MEEEKKRDSYSQNDTEALFKVYGIALRLRDYEIDRLTNRNNFFMVFQGVIIAGILQSDGTLPVVSFMVCLVGLFISIIQLGVAAGAKFWQVRWEAAVANIEKQMYKVIDLNKKDMERTVFYPLFSVRPNVDYDKFIEGVVQDFLDEKRSYFTNLLIMKRFSVSRGPIYVGLFLVCFWLLLLVCTVNIGSCFCVPDFIVGFPKRVH